jgi:tetratricopeptide (TPR) repeat protein
VANLRAVFRQYAGMRNYEKFRLYADSAAAIAARLPGKTSLAMVYNRMGAAYHSTDRLQAITFYNKSIEAARIAGWPAIATEAGSFLNLGALYMDIKDYPKSLEAHEKSLDLFGRMNRFSDMSSCYMNMSYIYANMGQKAKGMEYTRKALATFEKFDVQRGIAVAQDAIANYYLTASDAELAAVGASPASRFREATAAIEKGLKAALSGDDPSVLSNFYRLKGQLNEMQGNDAAALRYYLQAVGTNKESSEDAYGDNLIAAGRFYIQKQGDFQKGIGMMHEALVSAERIRSTGTIESALGALSDAHEKNKHYDSALYFYRRLIVVRNDIYNQEKEQEITRRQLKIDFDLKERDYRSAQQLADARLKQQEQEILLRRQQLQISDKEKSLQRLTFLQKQAELENQKKIQAALLSQEKLKAGYDKQTRDNQIKLQNVQLAFQQAAFTIPGDGCCNCDRYGRVDL